MRMCLAMRDNERACIVFLAIINGTLACSIHLETHDDVLCPHSHLGHYRSFAWISKGQPLYHYVWSSFIHLSTHWIPLGLLNGPLTYCIYDFALLGGLFLYYGAILVGLSLRNVIFAHYFISWGIIRPYKTNRTP